MNASTQGQIELSAILNLVPYLDKKLISDKPMTLGEIVDKYDSTMGNDETFKLLKQAVAGENNPYRNIELVNQSSTNSTSAWTDDLIQGCTFRDPNGNYYVAFRGTGNGRWADNGDGMTAPSTEMQEAAAAYFDEMAEKYLIDASNQGKDIIVTGHSKGGNEAQYTYMAARHEEIIDSCISLDGQGFSQSAIDSFKERFGDEYQEKLENMYSVNGENDFVHDLGIPIIPEENTYFVPNSGDKIPDSLHALENMISNDNGEFTGLNWAIDENGEITHGEQGPIGKLAKKISQEMMKMDPENLNGAALAIMDVVDPWDGDQVLGSIDVSNFDYLDLLAHGVPIVLQVLLASPEGWGAIEQFLPGIIENIYNEYGVGGIIGSVAAVSIIAAAAAYIVPDVLILLQRIDFIIDTFNNIKNFGKKIKDFIASVREATIATIQKISIKIRTLTTGYKYATANPRIVVDTYKLNNYAQRLQNVNRRIVALDGRLDSLYWNVGLLDLWNLMQADMMTKYSWKLRRCINYLNDTASDFSTAEHEITNSI